MISEITCSKMAKAARKWFEKQHNWNWYWIEKVAREWFEMEHVWKWWRLLKNYLRNNINENGTGCLLRMIGETTEMDISNKFKMERLSENDIWATCFKMVKTAWATCLNMARTAWGGLDKPVWKWQRLPKMIWETCLKMAKLPENDINNMLRMAKAAWEWYVQYVWKRQRLSENNLRNNIVKNCKVYLKKLEK